MKEKELLKGRVNPLLETRFLINVGGQFSGGLSNTTVTAWGLNVADLGWHLTDIPAGLTNVTAVSAGTYHSLALRANGTMVSWGYNESGQTNVPSSLTNAVAISAGGRHSLALRSNGTIAAWGDNSYGQCTVPNGLSNVMAVAAGFAHSMALKNDGTVVAWGDNSSGQLNVLTNLPSVKLISAGGAFSLATVFSPTVQYPVDVAQDLLLIYNTNSVDSTNVFNYYMAHRPMVSGANVLGIGCTNRETFLPSEYTNVFAAQVQTWLTANPTKRPQYVILFPVIPSRVHTNNNDGSYPSDYESLQPSVQRQIASNLLIGWHPFVTSINMNGYWGTNDCIAYINKLASFGSNYSPGKLIISASSTGVYGNTNFVLDNVRHGPGHGANDYSNDGGPISDAIPTITNACTSVTVNYLDGIQTNDVFLPHITNAANVAGYICWGAHSNWGAYTNDGDYSMDGQVKWIGNSGWWIIRTVESFNGQRSNRGQGNILKWFYSGAFGGTNYSNTPVGAVSYVDEPLTTGTDNAKYFGLWSGGKNFAICGWNSRKTLYFQAVGDPFVTR